MAIEKFKHRNEWRDKHYKRFELIVSLDEAEVIAQLNKQKSKSSYIVELIKEDIKKKSKRI